MKDRATHHLLFLIVAGLMPSATPALQVSDSGTSSRRAFLSQSAATQAAVAAAALVSIPPSIANAGTDGGISAATITAESTPLKLPPLGLGCWAWGDSLFWGYDQKNDNYLKEVFDYAVSKGPPVLFDSAEIYGLGRSETLLGAFSQTLANPDDVIVATKFAALPWRTKPESVVKACEASVKRLGTGRPIDLYQIHFPNAYANEAYWDGMAMAYERGLIRAVGVSNYGVDATRACHAALAKRGVPLSTNQIQYSLLYQYPEKSNGLLQCCKDLGMDVLSYSPLALGLLTGKYNANNLKKIAGPRQKLFEKAVANPQFTGILEAMKDVADGHSNVNANVPQVAINWCIAKGTIPIPGARNLRQVQSNYGSLDWKMSDEEVKFLDKASQGFSYIDTSANPFPQVDKDTGLKMFDS
jgi:pyridoxine 4-dehydrogenase